MEVDALKVAAGEMEEMAKTMRAYKLQMQTHKSFIQRFVV